MLYFTWHKEIIMHYTFKKSTTLCTQSECLQGVQNNECYYVLPSFHNNGNVTHQWAGTYKIRGIHLVGTCTYQADWLSFL
jgi:hypothetical protein